MRILFWLEKDLVPKFGRENDLAPMFGLEKFLDRKLFAFENVGVRAVFALEKVRVDRLADPEPPTFKDLERAEFTLERWILAEETFGLLGTNRLWLGVFCGVVIAFCLNRFWFQAF
ncbi:MAG: hypothetical protein HY912_06285 [Desulfomonile tiedjei]|uniref:Uncharacterized protein n=1 Tax=Desulfomonile tiedjei TaxID=2358 RepID=A0A9D6V323_9BACT|nr:hypothetical protein [Desulfomonile tiedjei]